MASTQGCVIFKKSADLSLRWLSWKLVTLMALALACRCSKLQLMEVPGIFFDEQGVKMVLQGLTKTSNSTNPVYS